MDKTNTLWTTCWYPSDSRNVLKRPNVIKEVLNPVIDSGNMTTAHYLETHSIVTCTGSFKKEIIVMSQFHTLMFHSQLYIFVFGSHLALVFGT